MELKHKNKLISKITALMFIVSLTGQAILAQPLTPIKTPHNFQDVVASLDKTLYIEEVRLLSNESRFTSYPGFFKAAEYIARVFREAGVQPYKSKDYFEWFNVTTPVTYSSWLCTSDGLNVTVYPLYPNLVNPSPYAGEDWDTLVYVGKGRLEDFNGVDVSGKFVLMDFASSWNFYNALQLGAKGVVYVPENPESVDRPEGDQKIALLPVYFPRVYVPLDKGGRNLLEKVKNAGSAGVKVKIKSEMRWENVEVPNVVGYIKGTDPVKSSKAVVIAAYYDAFSIVPSLAYGATDALGVATLLHLARFLAKNPPKYSVVLVALAGHYQGLWGAREFVERHFDELEAELIAFAAMDLASDSDQIGIYAVGSTYSYRYLDILVRRYTWLVSRAFGPWLAEMRMVLGSKYGNDFVDGILGSHPPYIRSFVPYEPYLYGYFPPSGVFGAYVGFLRNRLTLFDSDPFTLAMYGGGFTFRTTNAYRRYQWTPADTFEKIIFENVWPQVHFISCTLWAMLTEDINLPTSKARLRDDWGYVTLEVKVTTYNMFTSYWDVVNFTEKPELKDKLLVYVTSVGLGAVQKVDEKGTAIVYGLKPYAGGSVDVFAVDEKGRITWTTDVGVWQAPGWKGLPLSSHPQTKLIAIFECASIFIPFAFQPTDFRTTWLTAVNDARAHSPMIRQNALQMDMFGMAFVQPNVPAELMFGVGTGLPSIVLNNASIAAPSGVGYTLKKGEQLVLTPFHIFENLYVIVNSRYENLRSRNVILPVLEYYSSLTRELRQKILKAQSEKMYSTAFGTCSFAWAALLNWYGALMNSVNQVLTSIAVFFAVSLVFALLFERLSIRSEGLGRLLSVIALIASANLVLYVLHPAYHVATNWVIVLLTVSALALNIAILSIAFMNAYSTAKIAREAALGKHYLEISRTGLFVESMTLAVENMRKRRIRTILMLSAVTAIAFATISLASVTTSPVLLAQPVNVTYKPSFEGFLVRSYPWGPINPLSYTMLKDYLAEECYVVPRSFLYPPSLLVAAPGTQTGVPYVAFSSQLKTQIYGMLVVTPEERLLSGIDALLIEGEWFKEDDVYSVILTQAVADSLSQELGVKISAGSTIKLWNIELKVVGVIKDDVMRFANPDAEAITPLDPQSPVTTPQHLYAKNVMLIPFKLYEKLAFPPVLANVAIRPKNEKSVEYLKNTLPYVINYPIFSSAGGKVNAWLARQWFSAIGFEFILVPALLAAAAVLDMMLANVYERRREIHVFVSVGMAPSHVTAAFLMEALTYVVPAVFFGYVIGIVATNAMLIAGVFPEGLYPNFTSLAILAIIALNIVLVVAAAYYPSSLAGKLAVPSRVRRWLEAEKGPAGDEWKLSYPLVLSSRNEVLGFFNFLKTYIEALEVRESTFFSEKTEVVEQEVGGDHILQLIAHCRFAPYDLGIKSDVVLTAVRRKDSPVYSFELLVKRLEGYRQAWRTSSVTVVGELRRQVIAWRGLSPEERMKYVEAAG
ncbi:MAG: FtsX-like permease family protein [Thermofilaceae archaeon]|nr:FtsX-like permease family protein [Thermofilaceae archaeon]